MKSLPVYELGQWIKTGVNVGRIVARAYYATALCGHAGEDGALVLRDAMATTFESLSEYADNPHVQSMSNRGAGYCIEWVELQYEDWPTVPMTPDVKAKYATPYRRSWIRADTIAEKRYHPCENPIAPKIEADPDIQVAKQGETNSYQTDAKLIANDNTESIMRAMVDAGRSAEDWLRAYGLTL